MTTEQYLRALKRLGLTRASRATTAALGISLRQCQRIAAGEADVPATVALLLAALVELRKAAVAYKLLLYDCFPNADDADLSGHDS